jgi:hypothetical protein
MERWIVGVVGRGKGTWSFHWRVDDERRGDEREKTGGK